MASRFVAADSSFSSNTTFRLGYGWGSILMGKLHFSVETDVMMFMNHGCNGTYNHGSLELDDRERFSEQNLDVENLDER